MQQIKLYCGKIYRLPWKELMSTLDLYGIKPNINIDELLLMMMKIHINIMKMMMLNF